MEYKEADCTLVPLATKVRNVGYANSHIFFWVRFLSRRHHTVCRPPVVRATFPNADGDHTVLDKPELKPVKITIPELHVGYQT
jgi:hypothetical protein